MAITENKYTGDGSSVLYSFTFPYLEVTDIKVSLDGVDTTAYTLANATQIRFNTAPANGAAIRLYRQTDDENLAATFFPGSAIRAKDLNDNFTQNLYVTQESSRDAAQGIATADAATATANTALSNSSAAVSTANAASASAAAAVSTANTASSNASAAVSTANTASSNASAAVNTANSAAADAATAISTANGAVTTANSAAADAATAISTANTASSNASSAVSTANTASSNASSAVSTANTASSNASTALSTANTATNTANAAVVTANAADSKANQAIAAVAVALLFDIVPNVAAIPGSPQDGDAVEVTDATGIESFTPLANLPAGFVGDAGLSARIIYNAGGATWNWLGYFANNPDDRYAGPNTDAGTAALPAIAFGPTDRNTGIYSPGPDQVAVATGGTGRLFVDASGRVGVGTSTPSEGFQVVSATGYSIFNGIRIGSDGNNDIYKNGNLTVSAAAFLSLKTGLLERMRITADGKIGIGTSSPTTNLQVKSGSGGGILLQSNTTVAGTYSELGFLASSNDAGAPGLAIRGYRGTDFNAGYLTFNTGGALLQERVRIDGAGRVGIGTTSPTGIFEACGSSSYFRPAGGAGTFFQITAGAANGDVTLTASANSGVYPPLLFNVGGGERARIDSSGRLLVGTSTARSNFFNGAISPLTQVEGAGASGIPGQYNSYVFGSSTISGPYLILGKHRSNTVGASTVVEADDQAGAISFQASNGTQLVEAARVQAFVDGTPGANDMPGRLVFSTTADGASSPTEQLRITSDRYVRLASGTGGIQFNGDTAANNALDDYEEGTWTPTIVGSTTAGTGTYAFQNGRYTKIGRLVQFGFNISITAHTGTGNILIAGVPFAAAGGAGGQFSVRADNLTYTGSQIFCTIDASTLEVKQFSTASATTSVPIDTSFVLRVSGTYNV